MKGFITIIQNYSLIVVLRLLLVVAPLVAEHRLYLESSSFSGYSTWAQQLQLLGLRTQVQQLRHTDLVVLQHVKSSWTRNRTSISCMMSSLSVGW